MNTYHGENYNVPHTVDADGFVLIDGHRVHGNNDKCAVKFKATDLYPCQRCGAPRVQLPVVLWHRFEHALGRDFYWFAGEPEQSMRWGYCDECKGKVNP